MAEAHYETQPGVELRSELPRDAAIAAFAHARHGVVTTAELGRFGLAPAAVARRAKEGRLFRVHRSVYSLGRPDLTPEGRRMAAVLACGPQAVLSHRSAAAQHGLLSDWRELPDVTIPGPRRRPRPGIRVHSSLTLAAPDVTTVDGIPCTSVARTLVDLGDREPDRLVERAVDQAEVLGLFDLTAVDDALQRAGPKRGPGVLRRVLVECGEPAITDRELEERFLLLVRQAGLSAPEVNAWLVTDAASLQGRLPVENGAARHRDRQPDLPHQPRGIRARPPPRPAPHAGRLHRGEVHLAPGHARPWSGCRHAEGPLGPGTPAARR